MAALAVDKHLEVRRTAEQALATVHSLVDSSVVREHLDAVDLASDIRTTLLQILQVECIDVYYHFRLVRLLVMTAIDNIVACLHCSPGLQHGRNLCGKSSRDPVS